MTADEPTMSFVATQLRLKATGTFDASDVTGGGGSAAVASNEFADYGKSPVQRYTATAASEQQSINNSLQRRFHSVQ